MKLIRYRYKHRRALTKLRISSHSLEVERGRYDKTEAKDRICKYCQVFGQNRVEDETHFVVNCPQYKELREKFLPADTIQNIHLNPEEKLIKILSDTDNCKAIAKFACQAFEDRETGLEVLATIQDMVNFTEKACIANTSTPNDISSKTDSYMVKSTTDDGMRMILARVF